MLKIENIKKVYGKKIGPKTIALKDVSFEVKEGEFIAIMGESGSGKTTLLNILATLDKPTEGAVYLGDRNITDMKERDIAGFRRNELGFVFQEFNLLDNFSNKDNIFLPLVLSGCSVSEMEARLDAIVDVLGIGDIVEKYPHEVSGGQKQRVAIARAIITNPKIILADEPTGALDSSSSSKVLDIFTDVNKAGQTILMVTHSIKAASYANRILFIKDGVVFHEIYKGEDSRETFMDRISNTETLLFKGRR